MTYQIIVPHRFETLNAFIDANRKGKGRWNGGNSMKQKDQAIIRKYLPDIRIKKPVYLDYTFYEKDRKRDLDNVSGYFHKIFQDALVEAGILKNDNWEHIRGFSDRFYVDRRFPHIEIVVREVT